MPTIKNKKLFKELFFDLLKKEEFKKKKEIQSFVSSVLDNQSEENLPVFLRNYIMLCFSNDDRQDEVIKKIIELIFNELIDSEDDSLISIKNLYDLLNLLSLQKLSENKQLLQKLYKSLSLQDRYYCSGLYTIVAKGYNQLLEQLINLAKGDPDRIKDLYSALPLQNMYRNSALNILTREDPQTRLNRIKDLIKISYFRKMINIFMPEQKAIADRIAGIQEYCLSCLSTQGEYSVIPPKNTDSDEEDCAAYQSGNEADANGTLNAILNSIHNSLSFVEPVISRTSSTHSVSSNNSIKSLHSMNGVPTPTNSPRDSEQQDTPDLRACSPSP